MSIESKLSGHWTDEQLVEHLYGVGPGDGHLDACAACRAKLTDMQACRGVAELNPLADESVSQDFLMAQRRAIYARISAPARWYAGVAFKRWASAAAMLLVLGGSVFVYQERQRPAADTDRLTDVELARDVSRMSQDSEGLPTAPLQALFE